MMEAFIVTAIAAVVVRIWIKVRVHFVKEA